MNELIIYLIEASLCLTLLYGIYRLLLEKETFFTFNRFYLISILVFSMLLPLASFNLWDSDTGLINQQLSELSKVRSAYYVAINDIGSPANEEAIDSGNWIQRLWTSDWNFSRIVMASLLIIYAIGFAFLLCRLALFFSKLRQMKKALPHAECNGIKVVKLPPSNAPFSFMNTVFIPEDIGTDRDFDQVLAHEKTHMSQRHSIDLIFVQFMAALLWFNPIVWLLLKSLKQTHEYLADSNMLLKGFSLVEYQTLLLRQLISNNSYGLVHNFNLSFIKKRITMMSIQKSGWAGWSRAALAMAFILILGMATAHSNAIASQPSPSMDNATVDSTQEIQFYIDGIAIEKGLQYSELEKTKGQFRFKTTNSKMSKLFVTLKLIRKGAEMGRKSANLEAGESFSLRSLLDKAKLEDYLIIDAQEDRTSHLFNFPLFRDSKSWKFAKESRLLPEDRMVQLSINGQKVNKKTAMPASMLDKKPIALQLNYELADFVDSELTEQRNGRVVLTLVRAGLGLRSVKQDGVKRKSTVALGKLLENAQAGDVVVVQLGAEYGLEIYATFNIE